MREPGAPAPVVLVLASGRGERFLAAGGGTHKLHALLGDRSVLRHTLDAVQASGLPFHVEDAGHPGMGDSIAAAVQAHAGAPGWLILPADLPLVQPETLRRVAAALGAHEAAVPVYRGQRGHPVGFAAACGAELMALRGDRGAAAVLAAHGPYEIEVGDAGCVADIDTPEDLNRAQTLWHARAGDAGPDRRSPVS